MIWSGDALMVVDCNTRPRYRSGESSAELNPRYEEFQGGKQIGSSRREEARVATWTIRVAGILGLRGNLPIGRCKMMHSAWLMQPAGQE